MQTFWVGMDWVGFQKSDPCTTLRYMAYSQCWPHLVGDTNSAFTAHVVGRRLCTHYMCSRDFYSFIKCTNLKIYNFFLRVHHECSSYVSVAFCWLFSKRISLLYQTEKPPLEVAPTTWSTFSSCDLDPYAMTLTYKSDLDKVKLNRHFNYLGQQSFRWKVIVRAHTERHTHSRPITLYGHYNGRKWQSWSSFAMFLC